MDLSAEPIGVDGLLWAVHFAPGNPPRAVKPGERPDEGWVWMHYDLVHSGAGAAIAKDPDLPVFAKTVLAGRDETPRMLVEDNAVTGVLPAFAGGTASEPDALVGWHFAMQSHRLVTGRRTPVPALQAIRASAGHGHDLPTPAELIAQALADFAQEMRRRVALLATDLEAVEDALLEPKRDLDLSKLGPNLGVVRRAATRLRRPLAPVIRLLENDIDELPEWITQCSAHDAALRQTHAAIDDLVAVQERARVLQDELAARQAEETNRRLYIVSVVTTLIMPATLVTGFFGMNTGGLYMNDWKSGTHIATVICLVSLGLTWLLMRWRKLI